MRFPVPLRLALALSPVVVAGACGGSSGDQAANDACATLAQAACARRATCSNGTAITRAFSDNQTCIARETKACSDALQAPNSGATVDQVKQCATAYPTIDCVDLSENDLPVVCVPAGKLADGAACAFASQCQSTFCSGTKNANCGSCSAPPKAGDSCSISTCGHGLTCVGATQTCELRVGPGGTCDATHPCQSGSSCVGTTNTCELSATTVGAQCGAGLPGCAGNIGLHCTGAAGAKTCTEIQFVGAGQPCGLLADGSFAQCIQGDCYGPAGAVTGNGNGTCKTDAADGAGCDTAFGPGCTAPARCVVSAGSTKGVCTVPNPATCG